MSVFAVVSSQRVGVGKLFVATTVKKNVPSASELFNYTASAHLV